MLSWEPHLFQSNKFISNNRWELTYGTTLQAFTLTPWPRLANSKCDIVKITKVDWYFKNTQTLSACVS